MAIYRPHMNITASFNGPQNIPRGSKTIMSGLFPFKFWEYWKKLRQNGFLELFRGLRALIDRVSNQEIVQRWLWLHLLMTYYGARMGEIWTSCSSLITQLLSISWYPSGMAVGLGVCVCVCGGGGVIVLQWFFFPLQVPLGVAWRGEVCGVPLHSCLIYLCEISKEVFY